MAVFRPEPEQIGAGGSIGNAPTFCANNFSQFGFFLFELFPLVLNGLIEVGVGLLNTHRLILLIQKLVLLFIVLLLFLEKSLLFFLDFIFELLDGSLLAFVELFVSFDLNPGHSDQVGGVFDQGHQSVLFDLDPLFDLEVELGLLLEVALPIGLSLLLEMGNLLRLGLDDVKLVVELLQESFILSRLLLGLLKLEHLRVEVLVQSSSFLHQVSLILNVLRQSLMESVELLFSLSSGILVELSISYLLVQSVVSLEVFHLPRGSTWRFHM